MRALFSKVQTGVESPQAFAAYARSLTLAPEPGALPNPDAIVQAFVRDVLLTGNGTLFVNNTFVEWAAVQALRRAQPRLLVARYGVRDKLKPFSSLLLFSQPRTSDESRSSRIRSGLSSTSSSCPTTSGCRPRRAPRTAVRRSTCSSPRARTSCWRFARTCPVRPVLRQPPLLLPTSARRWRSGLACQRRKVGMADCAAGRLVSGSAGRQVRGWAGPLVRRSGSPQVR